MYDDCADLDPFRPATPRQIQLARTLARAREQLDTHGPSAAQLERIAELERQIQEDQDED